MVSGWLCRGFGLGKSLQKFFAFRIGMHANSRGNLVDT